MQDCLSVGLLAPDKAVQESSTVSVDLPASVRMLDATLFLSPPAQSQREENEARHTKLWLQWQFTLLPWCGGRKPRFLCRAMERRWKRNFSCVFLYSRVCTSDTVRRSRHGWIATAAAAAAPSASNNQPPTVSRTRRIDTADSADSCQISSASIYDRPMVYFHAPENC